MTAADAQRERRRRATGMPLTRPFERTDHEDDGRLGGRIACRARGRTAVASKAWPTSVDRPEAGASRRVASVAEIASLCVGSAVDGLDLGATGPR